MAGSSTRAIHRLGAGALFIVLLVALLHAFILDTEPRAAWRERMAGTSEQLVMEGKYAEAGRWFVDAADEGNLALHFEGFPSDDPMVGKLIGQFYFRAAYELYPRRVIVGTGDKIINSAADLAAADVLPGDQWLKAHDVNAVLTIGRRADGTIDVGTRKLH